jgi:hypothetical protein
MLIIWDKISKLSTKLPLVAVIVTVFCLNLGISKYAVAEGREYGSSTKGLNIEVPIEMSMIPCGSLAAREQDFNRTKVRLSDADYDGSPHWLFEIIAKNSSSSDKIVTLKTESGPKTYITVPANTPFPMRFRTASFTPDSGWAVYYLNLPVTTVDYQLIVWSSRIIIQQTHATKTRIQIPLFGRPGDPHLYNWAIYNEGPPVWPRVTSSVGSGIWEELGHSRRWKKEGNKYADLAPGACWTFEAVLQVADEGKYPNYCTLWNETTNQQVASSEVSNTKSTYTLHYADFPDSTAEFMDGHEFGVRTKGYASNPPRVADARLYVRLTNLSKVQIIYTVGYEDVVYAKQEKFNDYSRVLIDVSKFSSPKFYFESYGSSPDDRRVVFLRDGGTNDSGTEGKDVLESGISFMSNQMVRKRVGPIPLTGAKRYHVHCPASPKNVSNRTNWLIIEVQRSTPSVSF